MDLLSLNDPINGTGNGYPPSYYAAHTPPLPPFPSAKGALRCDVCIIGGGFTGLSAALHLARRGYDVVVTEARRVGFGASGRNGGQVGQGQRLPQDTLEKMVGKAHARALWDLSNQAVALVRELAASPSVAVNFHPGIIDAQHRRGDVQRYRDYVEKLRDDYGYDAIRFLDQEEMRDRVASTAYYGGTLDRGSGHINPLGFALGLARLAQEAGARLYEHSRVLHLNEGSPVSVVTKDSTISADYVIMGCNGYLGSLNNKVAARVMPINNFIIATAPMSVQAQEALIRENVGVADSKFVVNYFRFSEDHRLLFGGGENYRYRFPRDIAAKVRPVLLKIFPQLRDMPIEYAWGGTLGITMNRMPSFQRVAGNILSLSGYSGNGVAMATLAGQIAAETIAGQSARFDVMARLPMESFPGGAALRHPLLLLGMVWYSLRDKL